MNMVLKRDQNRRPNPIQIHLKIEVDKKWRRKIDKDRVLERPVAEKASKRAGLI